MADLFASNARSGPSALCEGRGLRPGISSRVLRAERCWRYISRYARLGQRRSLGQRPQPRTILEHRPAADFVLARRVAPKRTKPGDRLRSPGWFDGISPGTARANPE